MRITDAITAEEQRKARSVLSPSARYTRAAAVEIVQKEEAWPLFGSEGRAVLGVMDAGLSLDRPQAELLAASRRPDALAACDRLWRAWMKERGITGNDPESLDGVLVLGSHGSPVNGGLGVLHDVVFKRATALDGDAATVTDGEDVWLASPWAGPHDALHHAALALGCPGLVDSADAVILLHAWATVRR